MSRLEKNSVVYRENLINKNEYQDDDIYNINHPNALSDGDEWGKGEYNNSVGNCIDIKMREKLMMKNMYNSENIYNIDNA